MFAVYVCLLLGLGLLPQSSSVSCPLRSLGRVAVDRGWRDDPLDRFPNKVLSLGRFSSPSLPSLGFISENANANHDKIPRNIGNSNPEWRGKKRIFGYDCS